MSCSFCGREAFEFCKNGAGKTDRTKKVEPTTDLEKWRLTCVNGRRSWNFLKDVDEDFSSLDRPQTFLEKYLLGIEEPENEVITFQPKKRSLDNAIEDGVKLLCKLQAEDGHWPADYRGAGFVTPSFVIAGYVTNTPMEVEQKLETIRSFRSSQCPDGGWGTNLIGPPTVLATTLVYISMRILGVSLKDPDLLKALNILRSMGGTVAIPSWGKFMLAILNLYKWEGMNTFLPELWYMPAFLPFHPSKTFCHCRQVYLAMSYCYGVRLTIAETELIRQLREELYEGEYERIDWPKQKNNVSAADMSVSHTCLFDTFIYLANIFEDYHFPPLRKKAVDFIYENICFDDESTSYLSVACMSKAIQMIVRWHRDGPDSDPFKKHQDRIRDYQWMGWDGMKILCVAGSQTWDSVYVLQAIIESNVSPDSDDELKQVLEKGAEFLLLAQISRQKPDYRKHFREPNRGGFPFTTRENDWTVIDCTSEAIKTLMKLKDLNIDVDGKEGWSLEDRCKTAVDLLLSQQNTDGGFPSFEKKRGSKLLELFNPSEIFDIVMVDYSIMEESSAVIQVLTKFSSRYPNYRSQAINKAIKRAMDHILSVQREDGSWYGTWGVCFTYGSWFALEAFACVGLDYVSPKGPHPQLLMTCNWILSKQNKKDGGWGEKFESCTSKEYVPDESNVINTAWVLLGLMAVRFPDITVIQQGIGFLLSRQLPKGDFPRENPAGAFSRTGCVLDDSYRNSFPLMALSRYRSIYYYSSTQL